jgi:hypothetical protein
MLIGNLFRDTSDCEHSPFRLFILFLKRINWFLKISSKVDQFLQYGQNLETYDIFFSFLRFFFQFYFTQFYLIEKWKRNFKSYIWNGKKKNYFSNKIIFGKCLRKKYWKICVTWNSKQILFIEWIKKTLPFLLLLIFLIHNM